MWCDAAGREAELLVQPEIITVFSDKRMRLFFFKLLLLICYRFKVLWFDFVEHPHDDFPVNIYLQSQQQLLFDLQVWELR